MGPADESDTSVDANCRRLPEARVASPTTLDANAPWLVIDKEPPSISRSPPAKSDRLDATLTIARLLEPMKRLLVTTSDELPPADSNRSPTAVA